MRPIEDLQKDLKDILLVHGERSEPSARAKSLIGLAYYESEDNDRALIYFDDVSVLCKALEIHLTELGLDNEYRRGKVMELRATDEANQKEAAEVLAAVNRNRKQFDAASKSHTPASLDEQLDSTLIYHDEALLIGATRSDLAPAIALIQQCLELRKKKFGEASPALIMVMLDYADLLRSMEHYLDAKAVLVSALEIAVRAGGRMNEKVAEVLNSMGNLHRVMFELDEAEKYLLESFEIRSEVLEKGHVQLGASLNNLADVKRMQGAYINAITYHQQALEIFEASVGKAHPAYINAKGNYGVTLQKYAIECETKGEGFLNEAIDFLHAKAYQADHPWIQKFGHEQVLASARRLATSNEFARSIGLFDELIQKRHDHIASTAAAGAPVKATPSKSTKAGKPQQGMSDSASVQSMHTDATIVQHIKQGEEEVIHQLELEKFEVMLKYAEKLTDDHQITQAIAQVACCDAYVLLPHKPSPTEIFMIPVVESEADKKRRFINPEASLHEFDLYISLQHIKAKLHRVQAQYAAAIEVLDKIVSDVHRKRGKEGSHSVQYRLLLAEIHVEIGKYSAGDVIIAKVMHQLEDAMAKDIKLQNKASLPTTVALCRALLVMVDLRMVAHNVEAMVALMDRLYDIILHSSLTNHHIYISYLLVSIRINAIYGQFETAFNAIDQALTVQNNLTGKNHLGYADLLLEQALLQISRASHADAFKCIDESQKLLAKLIVPAAVSDSHDMASVMAHSLASDGHTLATLTGGTPGTEHPLYGKLYYVKAKYYHFLHRHAEALDYNSKSINVCRGMFGEEEEHPLCVQNYTLFAEIHISKCEYRDANEHMNKVLANRNAHKVADHVDYDSLYIEYLQAVISVKKGLVFHSLQALDKLIASATAYKKYYKMEGVLFLDGLLCLEYGKILLHTTRFLDAKTFIANSGIVFYDYYHQHSNVYIYQSLLRFVEIYTLHGKYKESKVLLSYIYNNLLAIFTFRYTNHPMFVDLYLLAVDNMRAVGYFSDAIEYMTVLKNKISVSYTTLTMEYILFKLQQAKIFKDRNMLNKAEPIFKEIESNISLLCGEFSVPNILHKLELAEAYIFAEQVAAAEKLLWDALVVLQRTVYGVKMDVSEVQSFYNGLYTKHTTELNNISNLKLSLLEIRILTELNHVKVQSSKPAVMQKSIENLQNTLIPVIQQVYTSMIGSNAHIFVYYAQGLHAVLSNKFKFNSGRRALFDALKFLDEFNPYNLPFDHPYVMALGGYEKSSSKNRLSTNINENALFLWAINREEGGEMLPKSIMIDISNHDDRLWGLVHYYGHDTSVAADTVAAPRRGRSAKAGRSRSPSPHGEAKGGNITYDEAFQAEQKARQQAEDQIVLLKHQNTDLIEQLTQEKDLTDKLSVEINELKLQHQEMTRQVFDMSDKYSKLLETYNATNKELQDMKLAKQLEEDEKLRRLLEAEAKMLADESERAKSMHPKYQKLLENAEYLMNKAGLFVTQGYYYDAMPLLEEGCSIRHGIYGINHMVTLQSYVIKANNLINVEYYESAKELIGVCLAAVDSNLVSNVPADFPVELQILLYYIYYKQGVLYAYINEFDTYVKDLETKVTSLSAESSPLFVHYGRAMFIMAHYYVEISKITEAKSLIEKSLTFLTKECGAAHVHTLEALFVKAYILFYNNKHKECINLCEQRLMALKISLKAHYEEFGSVVMTLDSMSKTQTNVMIGTGNNVLTIPTATTVSDVLKNKGDMIPHPLVAQTYLLICKAFYAMNNFSEMKNKLQNVKSILYVFYKYNHLLIYDYLFLESQLLFGLGHYDLSLVKHLTILKEREITVKYNYQMNYSNYNNVNFSNNLAITNALITSPSPAVNIMAHNMFSESLFSIAGIYIRLGKYAKAKEYLNNLIKLNVAKNITNPPAAAASASSTQAPATAAANAGAASFKGNHVMFYYAKGMLLYLEMLNGNYDDTSLYLENLLDELTGNSINKENLCYIYITYLLACSHFYQNDMESAEKLAGKAMRYLKNSFTEHALMLDINLLHVNIQLQGNHIQKAYEFVNQAKMTNINVYNISPEHENYAIVRLYEGKVLLHALVSKVDLVIKSDDTTTAVAVVEDADKSTPTFDNKRFAVVLDVLEDALERYTRSLTLDSHTAVTGPNGALVSLHNTSINTQEHSLPDSRKISGPPLFVFLKGLIGQIKLLEFTFLQTFINSLSNEEKEQYYSKQSALSYNKQSKHHHGHQATGAGPSSTAVPDPPGYKDLRNAIAELQNVCKLSSHHVFIKYLNAQLADLILQFDPLQIAHYNYNKALMAFNKGEYLMASKLFNLCIRSYYDCFGYLQSTQSYIIAELLYYKACTTFYLSQSTPFSYNLFLLSSRVYKLYNNSQEETLFIFNNMLGVSQLFMQQKQYEEALKMHHKIELSVDENYLSNPVTNMKIINSLASLEMNLFMIKVKIFIAQDHIAMFNYEAAQTSNNEALNMLKRVHAVNIQPFLAGTFINEDDNSVNNINNVNTINMYNINAILAELLILVYMNEVKLHDNWGRFKTADEYLTQIDAIMGSWENNLSSSTERSAANVDLISGAMGDDEEASHQQPAPETPIEAAAPDAAVDVPAIPAEDTEPVKEAIPDTPESAPVLDNTDSTVVSVTNQTHATAASQATSKNGDKKVKAAAPSIPEQGRYLRLKADLLHLHAEHLMALTKFNEVAAFLEKSLEVKYGLYNIHYPANWAIHGHSAEKKRSKKDAKTTPATATTGGETAGTSTTNGMDYTWSAQKEEEVNMNCMETLQVLFTNNYSNNKDIQKDGTSGNPDDPAAPAAETKQKDKEDVADYMSMITALNNQEPSDEGSVGNMSLLEIFDVKHKNHIANKIFVFQNQKVLPHFGILDSILLSAKLSMELCKVKDIKDALDTAQKFMAVLSTASANQSSLFLLNIQHMIANYRHMVNQLTDSFQIHSTILEKRLSIVPNQTTRHLDIMDSYYVLCKQHLLFNNYDESMLNINNALTIARNVFNFHEEHFFIQHMLVYCAEILYYKGYYGDANMLVDKCIANLKLTFSDLHIFIAHAYQVKAMVNMELCKFEESINYLNISKNIYNILYYPQHYSIGMVYYYLAQNYKHLNKFLETKQHLDMAIVIIRQQLGKYHYLTLFVLLEIGINFIDLGKYSIAVHILERVIYLLKKYLSKDHIMIASANFYMGLLYMHTGQLDKVLGYYNTALYIYRKLLNTDRHIYISVVLYHIYYIQGMQGAYEASVQSFDNIIAIMKLIYNTPHHIHIAQATYYLAMVFLLQNKIFNAQSYLNKVIDICKSIYTSNSEPILIYLAYAGLGFIEHILGNFEHAKAILERSVSHAKDILSPQHPYVAKLLVILGTIYNAIGKYNQAKEVLYEGYMIQYKTIFTSNTNHPELADTLLALAENCRHRGCYDTLKKAVKEKEVEEDAKESTTKVSKETKVIEGSKDSKVSGTMVRSSVNVMPTIQDGSSAENAGPSHTLSVVPSESKPNVLSDLLVDDPPTNDAKDDDSVPSVMISVIEMLDNKDSAGDDLSIPEQKEGQAGIEAESDLCALPLLQRALGIYSEHLNSNPNHHYIFNTKYLMAEVYKLLGRYEDALELHEQVFHLRRKHLGDQHFDTIQSLCAIADTLRTMKKIYVTNKLATHNDTVHKGSALGNDDINLKDLSKIAGTVTLQEHILALSRPLNSTIGSSGPYDMDKKVFMTNLDEEGKKKNKPLPMPKGYMGYAFPGSKNNMARPATAGELLAAFNQQNSRVNANPLHDVKKCLDFAMTLLKKVLNKDDPIHTGSQALVKKDAHKFEADHPLIAICLYNKSEFHRLKGDYANALKYLEQCLTMRRKLYRSSHVFISDCLYSMALLLYNDQRYVQCIPLFNKALEMRLQNFNSSHPSVAEIYNSLCLLHIKLGDFPLAQEYIKQALDICTTSLGKDHPGTGNVFLNNAALLQAMNQRDEAMAYYKKALENKLKLYKDGHPEISNIYNNMALLYKSFGKVDQAIEYYEKALDTQKKILGVNHPDVASTYNNLATLFAAMPARRFEGKEMFKMSLNIRINCFGQEHTLVANTMNNYAILLYELGETKAAKNLLVDAYEIRKKIFNNNNFSNCHPSLAESLANLAFVEYNQGSLTEAIALYEQALLMRKQIYTNINPIIATTYLQLSAAYLKNKNMKYALEYAEQAYNMRLDLMGELHADTLAAKKACEYLQSKSALSRSNVRNLLERMDDSSADDEAAGGGGNVMEQEMQKSLFIGEEAMEL